MPHGRISFGFLLLVCLALPLGGQESQRYIEEIEVRVINVDVVVTDPQGNPLTGLKQDDFELFENGRPVEISYFSPVVEGLLEPPGEGPPSEQLPADEIEARRRPVTWAIFLDQTNMRPAHRNEALRQLQSFLGRAMDNGDRGMVTNFDGISFRIHDHITSDRAQFLGTLQTITKERAHMGPGHIQEMMLRGEIQQADNPLLDEGPSLGHAIAILADEEAKRARGAIAAMKALLDVLKGVEGRVAVVYLGGGFKTLPAMGVTEVWRRRFPDLVNGIGAPRPEDHQIALQQEVEQLLARMLATRVTLYTIYAGESGSMAVDPEDQGQLETQGPILGDAAKLRELGSVREMAQRTGGRYFRMNPTLDRQLDIVRSDLSHYYSLGYVPRGAPGGMRNLRVRVKVKGLRVRHREAVHERTAQQQASDDVVAALFDARNVNPLGISVHADPERSTSRKHLPVRILVPLTSLTFLPQGDVHRTGLSFHFAIAAPDGTVWRLGSRELPLEIPHAKLATALRQNITYTVEVPLRAEGMRLAVSVQDRVAQTRSVITVPLASLRAR